MRPMPRKAIEALRSNFPNPGRDDWANANHAGNYPRLAAVNAGYNPDRFSTSRKPSDLVTSEKKCLA